MEKNYYEILEVNPRASEEVIKKAHQVLIKKYHPDLYVGVEREKAEEKIRNINEAYKTLSVPSSKRKYDRIWNSKFAKGKKAFSSKEENICEEICCHYSRSMTGIDFFPICNRRIL